ncbi:heme peroxidase, partial [Rhizopus stolonifer]
MNRISSTLFKEISSGTRQSLGTRSIMGANRVMRPSIMQRGYTSTGTPKKEGSGRFLFLSLAALGGVGGYYYTSAQSIKTKSTPLSTVKKEIDYEKIYNEIAELLEENPDYDDGSYGPVFLRLAWHASGTYDVETKTG